MKVRRLIVSDFQTNCYIYYDDTKAFIIDPGDNARKIRVFINDQHLNVAAILLTHGHIDHIGVAEILSDQYGCDIYIHEDDEKLIRDGKYNLSSQFGGYAFTIKKEVKYFTDMMNIANTNIKIHHTPGHTPGSVMIEFMDDHVIFSGDMLFQSSIGRYDFNTSSASDMKKSIEYIKTLDYECHVLPGHGNPTTLQTEIQNNPFFTGNYYG